MNVILQGWNPPHGTFSTVVSAIHYIAILPLLRAICCTLGDYHPLQPSSIIASSASLTASSSTLTTEIGSTVHQPCVLTNSLMPQQLHLQFSHGIDKHSLCTQPLLSLLLLCCALSPLPLCLISGQALGQARSEGASSSAQSSSKGASSLVHIAFPSSASSSMHIVLPGLGQAEVPRR